MGTDFVKVYFPNVLGTDILTGINGMSITPTVINDFIGTQIQWGWDYCVNPGVLDLVTYVDGMRQFYITTIDANNNAVTTTAVIKSHPTERPH